MTTTALVLRHRPFEPELRKVLPWLAAEKPDVFNAYQQTQGEKLEKSMLGARYVASFIGHEPGKAVFIGLYEIGDSKPLTFEQYWKVPAYVEMKAFGMRGFTGDRPALLWFDLKLTDFYAHWKGKLVIGWPPPERSWWRRAHRNDYPVLAVLEDSLLDAAMPPWEQIDLAWDELAVFATKNGKLYHKTQIEPASENFMAAVKWCDQAFGILGTNLDSKVPSLRRTARSWLQDLGAC